LLLLLVFVSRTGYVNKQMQKCKSL